MCILILINFFPLLSTIKFGNKLYPRIRLLGGYAKQGNSKLKKKSTILVGLIFNAATIISYQV